MAKDLTAQVRNVQELRLQPGGGTKSLYIVAGLVDLDRSTQENDFYFRVGPSFPRGEVESAVVTLGVASLSMDKIPGVEQQTTVLTLPINSYDVDQDQQSGQLEVRVEAPFATDGALRPGFVATVSFQLTVTFGS